jgi:hypothetical protein
MIDEDEVDAPQEDYEEGEHDDESGAWSPGSQLNRSNIPLKTQSMISFKIF